MAIDIDAVMNRARDRAMKRNQYEYTPKSAMDAASPGVSRAKQKLKLEKEYNALSSVLDEDMRSINKYITSVGEGRYEDSDTVAGYRSAFDRYRENSKKAYDMQKALGYTVDEEKYVYQNAWLDSLDSALARSKVFADMDMAGVNDILANISDYQDMADVSKYKTEEEIESQKQKRTQASNTVWFAKHYLEENKDLFSEDEYVQMNKSFDELIPFFEELRGSLDAQRGYYGQFSGKNDFIYRDYSNTELLDMYFDAERNGDDETAGAIYEVVLPRLTKSEFDTWLAGVKEKYDTYNFNLIEGLFLGKENTVLSNSGASTGIGKYEAANILNNIDTLNYPSVDKELYDIADSILEYGIYYSDANYDQNVSLALRQAISTDLDLLEAEFDNIEEIEKLTWTYTPENVEYLRKLYLRYVPEAYYQNRAKDPNWTGGNSISTIADSMDNSADAFDIAVIEFGNALATYKNSLMSNHYYLRSEEMSNEIEKDPKMDEARSMYRIFKEWDNKIADANDDMSISTEAGDFYYSKTIRDLNEEGFEEEYGMTLSEYKQEIIDIFKENGYDYAGYDEYQTRLANEKDATARYYQNKSFVDSGPLEAIAANIKSVLTSPFEVTAYLDTWMHAGNNDKDIRDYIPVDTNTDAYDMYNDNKAITNATLDAIDNDVGEWFYNTGMSMADMMYRMGVSMGNPVVYRALAFADVATQSTMSAIERGVSPEQAVAYGTAVGIVELLTESFSLGNLKALKASGASSPKEWLIGALKQVVTEGSEEAVAGIADRVLDDFINKDKSQFNLSVQNYIDQGYSQKEAEELADKEYLTQLLSETLAGAFSGGVFGGVTGGVNYASHRSSLNSYNTSSFTSEEVDALNYDLRDNLSEFAGVKNVDEISYSSEELKEIGNSGLEYLIDTVESNYSEDSSEYKAAEIAKGLLSEGKKITNKQTRELVEAIAVKYKETAETQEPDVYSRISAEQTRRMNETISAITVNKSVESAKAGDANPELVEAAEDFAISDSDLPIIHVDDIDSIVNSDGMGNMTVATKAGEVTVPASQFEGGKKVELYKAASMLDTVGAKEIVDSYETSKNVNPDLSLSDYISAFTSVYNGGRMGLSDQNVYADVERGVSLLGDTLSQVAFNAGEYDARVRGETEARLPSVTSENTGTVIDPENCLGEAERGVVQAVAEKLRIPIVVANEYTVNGKTYQLSENNPAKYIVSTATILLSPDANNLTGSLLHELGEFVTATSPAKAEKIRTALIKFYAEEFGSEKADRWIRTYQNAYAAAEGSKSYVEATNELMHDAMAAVFSKEKNTQKFIDWLNNTQTQKNAKSIRTWFAELCKKLKSAIHDLFAKGELNDMQKDVATLQESKLGELADMFLEALDESKAKVQKATKKEVSGTSEVKNALNVDKMIHAGMTDSERTEILKTKNLNVYPYNEEKYNDFKEKQPTIFSKSLKKTEAQKVFKKLAEQFGVFGIYHNDDIQLQFVYGANRLGESVNKNHTSFKQFAKMLSCFDNVIENAIGIEVHNRNTAGYKPDITLKNMYVLASAFEDGDSIVPVKIEVKEFFDKDNSLYLAISLNSIKKDRVVSMGVPESGSHVRTSPVNISISELIRNVKPEDTNFTKYFPKDLMTDEQIAVLNKTTDKSVSSSNISDEEVHNQIKINGQDLAHIDDNEELKAIVVDMIEQQRRTSKSRRNILSKDVRPFAKEMLEAYKSSYSLTTFTNELTKLYELMARGERKDVIRHYANYIGEKVLEASENNGEISDKNKSILSDIKGVPLKLTKWQREVLSDKYGLSFEEYAAKNSKYMTFSANGRHIHERWSELSAKYPGIFDSSMPKSEMAIELAGIALQLSNTYNGDINLSDDAQFLGAELVAGFDTVGTTNRTQADIDTKRISEVKKAKNKKIAEIRDFKNEQIKRVKAQYSNAVSDNRAIKSDYRAEVREEILYRYEKKARIEQITKSLRRLERMLVSERDSDHVPENLKTTMAEFCTRFINKGVFKEKNISLLRMQLKNIADGSENQANIEFDEEALDILEYLEEEMANGDSRYVQELAFRVLDISEEISLKKGRNVSKLKETLGIFKTRYVRDDVIIADKGNIVEDISYLISVAIDHTENTATIKTLRNLSNELKNTDEHSLSAFGIETLDAIKDVVDMFNGIVSNANELFIEGKRQALQEVGDLLISELELKGRKKFKFHPAVSRFVDNIAKANTTTNYFFKNVGGVFEKLYNEFLIAQDIQGLRVDQAGEFMLDVKKRYNYLNWRNNKYFITGNDGKVKFQVTTGELLMIYATDKRQQREVLKDIKHLQDGGVILEDKFISVVKEVENKNKKADENEKKQEIEKIAMGSAVKLSDSDISSAINKLTDEQKRFADEIVEFMSTVCADWGNETSMKLYNIRKYLETYYFPYVTPDTHKLFRIGSNEQVNRLLGASFTHRTVRKANTPIVLSDFTEIASSHIASMIAYSTHAIPAKNMQDLLNYKDVLDHNVTVMAKLQDVYGTDAIGKYIQTYLNDVQSGAVQESRENLLLKGIGMVGKLQVMAKTSVGLRQFSSLYRAGAELNPLYIASAHRLLKPGSKRRKQTYQKMKKHSGIVTIKEIGGFDASSGRSSAKWINRNEYGIKHPVQAALDKDKWDNALGALASASDRLAWCIIWEATEMETRKRIKSGKLDVRKDSKEYYEAVNKRFTQVINDTQVYNSVHAKTSAMRAKTYGMKAFTQYMGEPMAILNMANYAIYNALTDRSIKNTGKAIRVIFCGIVLGIIADAAINGFGRALKDDDEDESFVEKWAQSSIDSLWDNLNPISYIPGLKDVYNIFKGFSSEKPEMSLVSDIYWAFENVEWDKLMDSSDEKWDLTEAITYAAALITGKPIHNVVSDIRALWTTISNKTAFYKGTNWDALEDYALDSLNESFPIISKAIHWDRSNAGKLDSMYEALLEGNSEEFENIKIRYLNSYEDKTDDDVISGIGERLRSNAVLQNIVLSYVNSEWNLYEDSYNELLDLGFSRAMIDKAFDHILSEAETIAKTNSTLEKELTEEEKKSVQEVRDGTMEDLREYGLSDEDIEILANYTNEGLMNSAYMASINEDENKVLEFVNVLIDRKSWDILEDMPGYFEIYDEDDLEDKALDSVRSNIKNKYKALYLDAWEEGNGAEGKRILALLEMTGLFDDIEDTAEDWIEKYEEDKILQGK